MSESTVYIRIKRIARASVLTYLLTNLSALVVVLLSAALLTIRISERYVIHLQFFNLLIF